MLLLESLSVFPCFFVDNPKVNFIINLSIGLTNPTNGILFLDSSSYRTSNVNRQNRSRIKIHNEPNNIHILRLVLVSIDDNYFFSCYYIMCCSFPVLV